MFRLLFTFLEIRVSVLKASPRNMEVFMTLAEIYSLVLLRGHALFFSSIIRILILLGASVLMSTVTVRALIAVDASRVVK